MKINNINMRDKEIQLFSDGMNFAKEEFFLDAISLMNELILTYPDSELVDDAIYNIGLCYFNMNQFDKSISYFIKCIEEHPDGIISVLTGGNEYGNTSAKCWYAIMNCNLALGRIDEAQNALDRLIDYKDSYVQQDNGEKISFQDLAINAYQIFNKK